jgi:hypothetical protein
VRPVALFAIVLAGGLAAVWGQSQSQTSLTGNIWEFDGKTPIKTAKVKLGTSPKEYQANEDGVYSIPSLAPGQKIHVTYSAAGYGGRIYDGTLNPGKNRHDVVMSPNGASSAYFVKISNDVKTAQVDPQQRRITYGLLWNSLDESWVSPETKASAAHVFGATPEGKGVTSGNFMSYMAVDPSALTNAELDIDRALVQNGGLTRKLVPGNVAADVAADRIHRMKNKEPEHLTTFCDQFQKLYGAQATVDLKSKIQLGTQLAQ